MNKREGLRFAWTSIWSQKLKSFFCTLGVVIGVTSLIAVVSIVAGMDRYIKEDFAGRIHGLNTFTVVQRPSINLGNVGDDTRRGWRRRPRITVDDYKFLREHVRSEVILSPASSDRSTVRSGNRIAPEIEIIAADAPYFRIRAYEVVKGRGFTQQEADRARPVAVIGSEIAEKLFPGVDPIDQPLHFAGSRFTVIGTVKPQGKLFGLSLDKFIVTPWTSPSKRIVNPPRILDSIEVKATDAPSMKTAMEEIELLLRQRRRLRPSDPNNFELETSAELLGAWEKISKMLFLALPGLVGIALVVGGIVIMNIMLIAVSERTREIGIRRSLGARQNDILFQFLLEATMLSAAGGALGVVLGIGTAKLVAATTPLPAAVSPTSVALGLLLGCGVGITAGLFPARKAARLDPIEALRQE